MTDLLVFCANFLGEKMRLCYFLRFFQVCLTTTEEAKEGWGEGGSDIDHDEQVSKVIEDLRLRTDNFLEKVQKIYNLMLTNRFNTGYIFTQLHITQELITEESRISTD